MAKNNGYKNPKEPHFYYLTCAAITTMFAAVYINPITCGVFFIKELYNLEEFVRGIKDEEDE